MNSKEITERVNWFCTALASPMIVTKARESEHPSIWSFDITLRPDEFISPGQCPNLSEAFYARANELAASLVGKTIAWNNTATTGWFYFPEFDANRRNE